MSADRIEPSTSPTAAKADRWLYPALWTVTLCLVWTGVNQAPGLIGEETTRVSIAAEIAATGNLDPYWYGHPATLINYLLAGIYKLLYTIQGQPFTRLTYGQDHEQLVVIGRIISRLIAAACGPLTFALARTLLPIRWALFATAITILNPLFITHAHRARADHVLTIILVCSGLFAASKRPIKKTLIPLSLLAGLGFTFKYLSASIIASTQFFIATDSSSSYQRKAIRAIKSLLIFATTIFISSPYLYLQAPKAFRHFTGEVNKQSSWTPWASLYKFSLINAYGYSTLAVLLLAVISLWVLMQDRPTLRSTWDGIRQTGLGKLSAIYLPFIAIGFAASTYNSTWLTPALPYLSILIATLLHELLRNRSGHPQWIAQLAVFVTITAILTTQANKSWAVRQLRSQTGSTREAELWLQKHSNTKQSVLLLQPDNANEPASYPRFNSERFELFKSNPDDSFSKICEETPEKWISKHDSTHLIHMDCFPQPILSSKSNQRMDELLRQFDLVVISERYNPDPSTPLQATTKFSPPQGQLKLNYSPFNFPQGDSGAWKTITIYKGEKTSNLNLL